MNKEFLGFITSDLASTLLIKHSDLAQYENIPDLSKYKKEKYKSLRSKLVHQQFILKIANTFKTYNSIYFPVKLDHRGRLYCIPSYLNYQSSDLAKGLILFSIPGIVNKNNLDSIKYLKAYGANSFGGEIATSSIYSKQK